MPIRRLWRRKHQWRSRCKAVYASLPFLLSSFSPALQLMDSGSVRPWRLGRGRTPVFRLPPFPVLRQLGKFPIFWLSAIANCPNMLCKWKARKQRDNNCFVSIHKLAVYCTRCQYIEATNFHFYGYSTGGLGDGSPPVGFRDKTPLGFRGTKSLE